MRPTRRPRRRTARNPLGAVATLAVIGVIAVIAALFVPPSSTLAGRAEAVDGDTLRIGRTSIRLLGLDAVELDQQCSRAGVEWACGRDAHSFLAGLLKATETSCASNGRDQYRRVLARCRVNDRDLGDAIVRAGWATADIEYALALAEARLQGRGIWSGDFDDPADWRRSHGDSGSGIWEWLRGLFGY